MRKISPSKIARVLETHDEPAKEKVGGLRHISRGGRMNNGALGLNVGRGRRCYLVGFGTGQKQAKNRKEESVREM